MDEHESRRRFLMNMTALGAAGGVAAAMGANEGHAAGATPQMMAAAETQPRSTAGANDLPRIHLIVSAGTLPSVGKTRMDLLRYRESGIPRLTGAQLLEPLPEVATVARVTVEQGPPPDNSTYDALR